MPRARPLPPGDPSIAAREPVVTLQEPAEAPLPEPLLRGIPSVDVLLKTDGRRFAVPRAKLARSETQTASTGAGIWLPNERGKSSPRRPQTAARRV